MAFHELDLCSAEINPFKTIGKEWFLLTAGKESDYNTMTASWGFMGVMWNKNVFITAVRPNRHTFQYMENNDTFSVCFFDEEYRDALKFCGAHSGRDYDKAKETGLTPTTVDGVPAFEEAKMVLVCKKLYRSTVDEEKFIDNSIFDFYKNDPFHVGFAGEILKAYSK